MKRTHASACGIGQAVKQDYWYAAAKKMGGEEAGDVVADQRRMPARFLWLAQVGRDGSGAHGSKTLPVAGRIRYR